MRPQELRSPRGCEAGAHWELLCQLGSSSCTCFRWESFCCWNCVPEANRRHAQVIVAKLLCGVPEEECRLQFRAKTSLFDTHPLCFPTDATHDGLDFAFNSLMGSLVLSMADHSSWPSKDLTAEGGHILAHGSALLLRHFHFLLVDAVANRPTSISHSRCISRCGASSMSPYLPTGTANILSCSKLCNQRVSRRRRWTTTPICPTWKCAAN